MFPKAAYSRDSLKEMGKILLEDNLLLIVAPKTSPKNAKAKRPVKDGRNENKVQKIRA